MPKDTGQKLIELQRLVETQSRPVGVVQEEMGLGPKLQEFGGRPQPGRKLPCDWGGRQAKGKARCWTLLRSSLRKATHSYPGLESIRVEGLGWV